MMLVVSCLCEREFEFRTPAAYPVNANATLEYEKHDCECTGNVILRMNTGSLVLGKFVCLPRFFEK